MKKFLLTIVIGITMLTPSASFAAEEKFFEFATDVGTPIEVSTGSVAIQEFKIHNDYINAVDVWFDNAGSAGNATFALLDAAGTVLASRTVTVGHSDPFYTGQRLHVNFNKSISVSSGSWYKLRITSNTTKLRLYGIKRVQFVEHDAPYPIDSAVGASLLNDEAQLAVFKFALYEESDTEAPIITNVTAAVWGSDSMRISFNASELADRSLSYTVIGSGSVSTVGYTGNHSICFEGVFACPITIDVQRNAQYTYRLTVRDSWGNEAYVDGAFESWKPGTPTPQPTTDDQQPATQEPQQQPSQQSETQPLVISNARVAATAYDSVTLAWDTDRAANSAMTISSDPLGAQVVSYLADGTYELVHTIASSKGLTAGASYYATIVSRDLSGISAAQVVPFTTAKVATPSQPSATPGALASSLQTYVSQDNRSASIAWSASTGGEPANGYRVDIIDENGNLFRTDHIAAGTHSIEVTGLVGGDYHAIVYADNKGVVEKIAEPVTISVRKTAPPIDTYELIKKPIVYIPFFGFVMLVAGLYWYSRKQKHIKK